jgi:hypothetical protein
LVFSVVIGLNCSIVPFLVFSDVFGLNCSIVLFLFFTAELRRDFSQRTAKLISLRCFADSLRSFAVILFACSVLGFQNIGFRNNISTVVTLSAGKSLLQKDSQRLKMLCQNS